MLLRRGDGVAFIPSRSLLMPFEITTNAATSPKIGQEKWCMDAPFTLIGEGDKAWR